MTPYSVSALKHTLGFCVRGFLASDLLPDWIQGSCSPREMAVKYLCLQPKWPINKRHVGVDLVKTIDTFMSNWTAKSSRWHNTSSMQAMWHQRRWPHRVAFILPFLFQVKSSLWAVRNENTARGSVGKRLKRHFLSGWLLLIKNTQGINNLEKRQTTKEGILWGHSHPGRRPLPKLTQANLLSLVWRVLDKILPQNRGVLITTLLFDESNSKEVLPGGRCVYTPGPLWAKMEIFGAACAAIWQIRARFFGSRRRLWSLGNMCSDCFFGPGHSFRPPPPIPHLLLGVGFVCEVYWVKLTDWFIDST